MERERDVFVLVEVEGGDGEGGGVRLGGEVEEREGGFFGGGWRWRVGGRWSWFNECWRWRGMGGCEI